MDRVGFVGLGRMGRPMASNIRRRQYPMTVFDIAEAPVAALEELGAARAAAAGAVAKVSDVTITMLPGPRDVMETILGPDGILAHARPGSIIMDMSTVDPETTDAVVAACAARGVSFVDAPVGRTATFADAGKCLFMVGASDADFARVKPILEAMGDTIHHCGAPGTGTRTKLINNLLAVASCQMNAEALALTTAFGLDLPKTLEVIHGTTATNGQLKINWVQKVLAGDIEPGFSIDLAHKDLSLIVNAANAAKVPMPMVGAAREMFSQARARGHGRRDFSAILDAQCEVSGVVPPRLPKG